MLVLSVFTQIYTCVVENSINCMLFFYTQFQIILHLRAKPSTATGFVLIGKLIPYNFYFVCINFHSQGKWLFTENGMRV